VYTINLRDEAGKAYFQLKRYARRYWKRLSKRIQNFYLFIDSPERWKKLFFHVLMLSGYESALDIK